MTQHINGFHQLQLHHSVHMRSYLVQISILAKSGRILCARQMFDEMPSRDTIAWNAMISGYSHAGLHQEALSLFWTMRIGNEKPDHFTYTAVLSACAGIKDLQFGKRVHGLVFVSGYDSLLPVGNALIDMYGKCFSSEDANSVFQEMGFRNEVSWCSLLFSYVNIGLSDAAFVVFRDMPRRVVVAWNTIIAGNSKLGEVLMCMNLFKEMLEDCCSPDQWTLSALMNACAVTDEPSHGHMVQGFIIKSGWSAAIEINNAVLSFYVKFGEESDILKAVKAVRMFNEVSWNTITDAYMKIGNVGEAYRTFQFMLEKNLISWTSMITGFMRNGHGERAITLFVDMTRNGFYPDNVAFGAVLHACSNFATLGHGRMVHGSVVRSGFHAYPYVGNGLVNMYAKCGDICDSQKAFNDILVKDLISWNTMLFAFGLHGCSSQALRVFEEMLASRLKPDKVTFIGLLMTCSHLGLIEKGLFFLESMSSLYGVSPEIDHLACVLDMLCRCGKLEKAKEMSNKYIGSNNVKISSLEVLFGTYSAQGDLSLGAELGERLQSLKPRDEMSYVLLSNLYCASGQWKQAQTLRKAMAEQGVKKTPGCSWVEVRNQVTSFVAGRNSYLFMEDVHMMLYDIESEIRHPSSIFCWDGIT